MSKVTIQFHKCLDEYLRTKNQLYSNQLKKGVKINYQIIIEYSSTFIFEQRYNPDIN